MKTNELIKKMETIGLDARLVLAGDSERVRVSSDSHAIAFVSTKEVFKISCCDDFSDLTVSEKSIVFNALVEYASTPIEEREEKKRYKYRLKDIAPNANKAQMYLNYGRGEDSFYLDSETDGWGPVVIFEEDDPLLESVNLDMFDKIEVDEDGNAI